MGHVPAGPLRLLGQGCDVQGRQHRGAPRKGDPVATSPAPGARRGRDLGAEGERRAAAWYEERGYEVLARNWRCREGELDLVARRGGVLVFCEVKARSGTAFGVPAEAVTAVKQARIRRLAARWLAEQGNRLGRRPGTLRFDVVAVLGGELEVFEEAF